MNKPMLVLLLGALTLGGCGTHFPSVQYEKVTAKTPPDLEGLVKFNLPKTILKLDRDKIKNGCWRRFLVSLKAIFSRYTKTIPG